MQQVCLFDCLVWMVKNANYFDVSISRYQEPLKSTGDYHDFDTIDPASRLILMKAREGNSR